MPRTPKKETVDFILRLDPELDFLVREKRRKEEAHLKARGAHDMNKLCRILLMQWVTGTKIL